MRSIPVWLLFLILLIACKEQKKSKGYNAIEVVDTEMTELKKEPPIKLSNRDSIKLISFWKRFQEILIKNDTNEIIKLSLKNVYCPAYKNNFNYYPNNKLVPLWFFLHAPYRGNYIHDFSSYLNKVTPKIYVAELDSLQIVNLGLQPDKKILTFSLYFNTKESKRNYVIYRDHIFEFIKSSSGFKFMGLQVNESGSSYQYKLMSCDSLYFPLFRNKQNSVENMHSLDTALNKWYSASLFDFNEPNIYTYNGDDEIYRFTWLRSFHNPVIIRFVKHDNAYTLYTKELLDNDGYIPQEIKVNAKVEMTSLDWQNFKSKIDDLDFWNIVSNDTEPRPNDGAEWILEGVTKNEYHFITRTSSGDAKYRACCKYLLFLSKLKIPEENIY
jgi:hypothetical protein